MKHILGAITLACLCGALCIGCNGSESTSPESSHEQSKDRRTTILSIDSATIQNVGTIHNDGLAFVRSHYDFNRVFADEKDQSTYILSLTASYFHTEGDWDSSSINTVDNQNELAVMLARRYPVSDVDSWEAVKGKPTFTGNVDVSDIAMIDDALEVLSWPTTGMTNTQIANRVIDRTDSLIAVWTSSGGSEVSGGFLYLMKGTASYWRDHPVTPIECPANPPELGQLVQVDCVGFLVGWYLALSVEIGVNGRADINNQGKRLGAGAATAISWSFGGPVRKYFGG